MVKKVVLCLCILFSCVKVYAGELRSVSADNFIAEAPSSERAAVVDFIVHQFDDKRQNGITQAQLDKLWNDKELRQAMRLVRFQIIDQKLYAEAFNRGDYYFKPLFYYFQNFIQRYKVKDVDFIVYARDEIPSNGFENKTLGIPAFMMSKNMSSPYEKEKLLLPDAWMLDKTRWEPLIPVIEKAKRLSSWNQKYNKVFWRGGSHGSESKYLYNITNFDKLARLKLVMFSKLYPNLIDAEFSTFAEFSADQDGDNLKTVLNLLSTGERKRVNESGHLKYKYLITVDGNTCPWVRVPWIMLSNSALVKQETANTEWFYSALKPYVNYVPVRKDLTDIFDQIEWMRNNDEEVRRISANAQSFVKNNLMPEHIEAHMALILNEYASIQKDTKIIASLPESEMIFAKTEPSKPRKLTFFKKAKLKWRQFISKIKQIGK
jgi:hypothetical protein